MFYLIVQTVLLLAIAFILGAILGCLLRRWFAADAEPARTEPVKAATPLAGTASARLPHVPDAPQPEVVPQPIAAPVPPVPEVAEKPEEVPPATLVGAAGLVGGTVSDDKPAKKPRKPAARKATPKKPAAKTAPASTEPDNLKLIRGIGPQNEGRLNAIGVSRFDQIAGWTKKDQREMGERLSFPGRIEREEWVKQAKQLAKGKATEFSTRAGSGRVKTSSGAALVSAPGTKPPLLDAARGGKPDNLTLIDGVGNAIERKLFKLGIFHFDQVAAWSEDEGVWVGNEIGFPGRVAREGWVAESKIFAEGGTTDHAARVERGQIKTSRKSKPDEK